MQFNYVGAAVEPASRFEQIGVFREEASADDPPFEHAPLEVRIGEAHKYFLERLFWEILTEVAHRVSPYHSNVVELPLMELTESTNLFAYVVCHLVSDLQTHYQPAGKERP